MPSLKNLLRSLVKSSIGQGYISDQAIELSLSSGTPLEYTASTNGVLFVEVVPSTAGAWINAYTVVGDGLFRAQSNERPSNGPVSINLSLRKGQSVCVDSYWSGNATVACRFMPCVGDA